MEPIEHLMAAIARFREEHAKADVEDLPLRRAIAADAALLDRVASIIDNGDSAKAFEKLWQIEGVRRYLCDDGSLDGVDFGDGHSTQRPPRMDLKARRSDPR